MLLRRLPASGTTYRLNGFTMAGDQVRAVHADFRLIERDAGAAGTRPVGVREVLRHAYAVPLDTFITSDFALLLTQLCLPPSPETGPRVL